MAGQPRPTYYPVEDDGPVVGVEPAAYGLRLYDRNRDCREQSWLNIALADPAGDGLRLVFVDGSEVRLAIRGERRERLLAIITEFAPQRTLSGDLTPEDIERRLGVEPGGALVWRRPVEARWWTAALLVLLLVLLVFDTLRFLMYAYNFWIVGVAAVAAWRQFDRVSADGQGLVARRFGRRIRCPWSEVTEVRLVHQAWRIETSFGPIVIGRGEEAIKIFSVVQHVLAARAAGRFVPDQQPVDAASLSRLTGEPEADDRGLSLTESQHDD
jgi:hypothetical protein